MKRNRKYTALWLSVLALIVLGAVIFIVVHFFTVREKKTEQVGQDSESTLVESSPVADEQAEDDGQGLPDEIKPVIHPEGTTLQERVAVPEGFVRTEAGEDSLETFLREYPLKKDGKPVLLYNGDRKGNQSAHAAVFKLPIENEDLQQCADSVMRVYAEYFWKTKQYDRISFRFVDGFQADYVKWRQGNRIQTGNSTYWVSGGSYDASYNCFKKYLRMVFAYAGTLSMKAESKKIKLSKIRTGDIFLNPGSPGHVVMVVDVCKNAEGKKAFLLGQGYMPAQEFHLLKNPTHEEDPWYYEEEITYPLMTPEYVFEKGTLRRPVY